MPTVPRPDTVYYFGTCVIDLLYPEAGLAGVDLLEREGLTVVYPPDQSCCGQPAYTSGYPEPARAVARSQIALFPEPWPVVVPSGSCAGTMAKKYRLLFAGTPEERAVNAFADRVYELTEFLVDVMGVAYEDRGPPTKVCWHGSCGALRDKGVDAQPKSLLGGLANVELVTAARERECCGFGGTFSVRFPEVSAAMVTDKLQAIEATGAGELVSGDCSCLMNITGARDKRGGGLRSRHVAEFLLDRIRDDG